MPEDHFGEEIAARYDDDGEMFDPAVVDPAVDFLAALAGDGAALELGIGTGRIAVPLAQRGVCVHGIDLSDAVEAEEMFVTLMGEEVEPRRNFIVDNALNVRNLDV